MAQEKLTTAEEVLTSLRQRSRICPPIDAPGPSTMRGVLTAFETKMSQRSDLGIVNRALNLFLESQNPFEPQKTRRPKMETVIFGTLAMLAVAAILFFNLSAPHMEVLP